MRMLVTGGRGQLGRSLESLAAEFPQHEFLFTDMPETDILDARSLARACREFRPGAVINCAAYTAVDRAESEPEAARALNALGPAIVAAAAKECGAAMVHISTDYVFGGATLRVPIAEDAVPAPLGVYGRTKAEGERAVAESGADAAIIRTAWLYSEFGNNFVKTMLRLSGQRDEVAVVADQFGSPTYAPDLARAIVAVVEHGISGTEIYHYTDSGCISWYEFACEIFRQAGRATCVKPITSDEYPSAARRPLWSVLDKGRIEALGAAVPSWRDSLAVCLARLGEVK